MTVEGSCAYIVSNHGVSITPWRSFWAVNRSKYNLPTITWNVIPKGNMNKGMCLKHVDTHVSVKYFQLGIRMVVWNLMQTLAKFN